jgi:hypothetical protein
MRIVIIVALVLVVVVLGGAGLAMLRRRARHPGEPDTRMAHALAWRVGLSIALFLFVLLGWRLGWITPTGLPTGR